MADANKNLESPSIPEGYAALAVAAAVAARAAMPADPPAPRGSKLKDPAFLLQVFQIVVVGGLGWFFTDRVSNALEQKKLDLANVTQMQGLVTQLVRPSLPLEDYTGSAVALATFGTYSIVPFMQMIQDGDVNQSLAAETGLRVIAMRNPREVAAALERALANRNGFYSWKLHDFAARTLGEMNHRGSLPVLIAFRDAMGPGDATVLLRLAPMVRDDDAPTLVQAAALRKSLDLGIRMLEASGTESGRP